MPVRSGARLGPYEILDLIGAGGMGEVYKARDTRLDRTVAIKILPPELAVHAERRHRFEREAKTISQLSHPHICALYDVGEATLPSPESPFDSLRSLRTGPVPFDSAQGGPSPESRSAPSPESPVPSPVSVRFLVMEHLEGETLAARLERGTLPLDQALRMGAEIAAALAYAHRHGVVHRDLKPANVMLTASGVKLLDFGLAKLQAGFWLQASGFGLPASGSEAGTTADLTTEGRVLGTVPYMAPEQIEGKEADARTDIFALGCVLYEMVAGRRAFEGETSAALMTAILKDDPPPLTQHTPLAPPAFEHVVRTCLAKDPDERWQSAADIKRELTWIADQQRTARGTVESATATPVDVGGTRRPSRAGVLGVLGLLVGLVFAAWLLWPAPRDAGSPPVAPTHFITDVRPADALGYRLVGGEIASTTVGNLTRPARTALALSPDGRYLVFVGLAGEQQQLYLREWSRSEASPIAGTDGADSPFFSPDGRWIGFWARGQLRKVPVEGGQAVALYATGPLYGASWGSDDRIVFAVQQDGLWSVSANGGAAEPLTALDPAAGEVSHRLPQVLPGARQVLFTVLRGSIIGWQRAQVVVQALDTGKRTVLVEDGADGRYIPSGHLVFGRRGSLLVQPFDPVHPSVRREAVTVLGSVMQSVDTGNTWLETGATQLAVSASGTLVYVSGGPATGLATDSGLPGRRLVWLSRNRAVELLPAPSRPYLNPRLSPDGRYVAVGTQESPRMVWVYDLVRQTLTRASTMEGHARNPLWTPDGQRLTFSLEVNGITDLVWMAADGSTPPAHLLTATGTMAVTPACWSSDGRTLVFVKRPSDGTWRIGTVAVGSAGRIDSRVFETRFNERWPDLSPDGRWLAYVSNESGRDEVYVQAFPERGAKQQVSNDGGIAPAWSHDGHELFYVREAPDNDSLVAVEVNSGGELSLGAAQKLFDVDRRRYFLTSPTKPYDVTRDGSRFLFVELPEVLNEPPTREIHVVFNWFEELKAKVPTR